MISFSAYSFFLRVLLLVVSVALCPSVLVFGEASPSTRLGYGASSCWQLITEIAQNEPLTENDFQDLKSEIQFLYQRSLQNPGEERIAQSFLSKLPDYLRALVKREIILNNSPFFLPSPSNLKWEALGEIDEFMEEFAISHLEDEVVDKFNEALLATSRDKNRRQKFKFPRISSDHIRGLLWKAQEERKNDISYRQINDPSPRRAQHQTYSLEEIERATNLVLAFRDLSEEEQRIFLHYVGIEILGPITPYHFLWSVLTFGRPGDHALAETWGKSPTEIRSQIGRIKVLLRNSLQRIEKAQETREALARQSYTSPQEAEELAREEVRRYREEQLEALRREISQDPSFSSRIVP